VRTAHATVAKPGFMIFIAHQEKSLKLWLKNSNGNNPLGRLFVTSMGTSQLILGLALLGFLLAGCQNESLPPAPLGERAALEQLADAYESLSEQLPVSPSGLTPSGKLKFVEAVFKQAGYDFTATVQALAQVPPETLNTYHKDMMELVLLPNQGLSHEGTVSLYTHKQLPNIVKIKALYAR
jgi:hypothetical protein